MMSPFPVKNERLKIFGILAAALIMSGAEPLLSVQEQVAGSSVLSDPLTQVKPPAGAAGYPDRSADFDALPGFRNPPPGYNEVPFWWWTGDELNVERLLWQVDELHKKGISGVQVNYSHYDTPGWLTEMDKPALFSDEWWKVYTRVSEKCADYNMGIGLSTYTIDWPRGATNLFYHLFYSKPELNALELVAGERQRLRGGVTKTVKCVEGCFAVHAYQVKDGLLQSGGIGITPNSLEPASQGSRTATALPSLREVSWTAPDGEWEVWSFGMKRKAGSMNPLMSGSGDTVIRGFFQQFQDHNKGKTSKGLNYFFNDELHIGLDKYAWNPDFTHEFKKRKGYDLLEVLPAMWVDMGDATPKLLMDYADVRMSLMEERYFKPIYDWHASRGMIFGCDPGSRGQKPDEFGDYFRAIRWYSAPGHDTPGGNADLIKGKVSSSIANLYQRPRVWLEGYHSLGWGASPERLMFATRENYLYGCTLLNLHGLYYSTYGSHWEWAPPCYHFRMPYWKHMKNFLGYFERLSFLMSQGHTLCDVAVIYPVAPYQAEMNGNTAKDVAFSLGRKLMQAGINFEFIDADSLSRARVQDERLVIDSAGASYQALVVPHMNAVRWQTIEKAAVFAEEGGHVFCVGNLPEASDRAGRNDPQLDAMNKRAFKTQCCLKNSDDAVEAISKAFVQDVRGIGCTVRALHRKAGSRDVYLVMDAAPGSLVEFRTKGAVELWDPWTGGTRPLRLVESTSTGSRVELPLEKYEAQVVVFTPDRKHVNPPEDDKRPLRQKYLPEEWQVSFEPTMDNLFGDFRLPVTSVNKVIGLEARRFDSATETQESAETAMRPDTDVSSWTSRLHGYGPGFYLLGPVPSDVDIQALDAMLAAMKSVDPSVPINAGGVILKWSTYDFSWRYGREGDPGHQGYHGLKRTITDDFICLGKPKQALNETQYVNEHEGDQYYLWTSATVPEALKASICVSREPPFDKSHTSRIITPASIYINGVAINNPDQPVTLNAGPNPTLVRYNHAGRGYFVMRRSGTSRPAEKAVLAMRWYNDPAVIPFDIHSGRTQAEWLRFTTAPGTSAIRLQVRGEVQAWINGQPMKKSGNGRLEAPGSFEKACVVALRIIPEVGFSGAASIEEPVIVETDGKGVMPLGDWSKTGILNNYSGGVRYRTNVDLSRDQASGKIEIDLGRVTATAEVHVNGRMAGVLVAPPWRMDISGLLRSGPNEVEVLVYNTLANHYQTIPSRYRGSPESGLFGPVRLLSRDWKQGDDERLEIVSKENGVCISRREGTLTELDETISSNNNLMQMPEVVISINGSTAHSGGGNNFSALFNNTAANGIGGEETRDDGKTFAGMKEGNTLEFAFDPEKMPGGVNLVRVKTYAGHADGRASQNYTLFASEASDPDNFIRIAEVDSPAGKGLNMVSINELSGEPLLKGVRRVRFVFHDGPLGFNVYREIVVEKDVD